MKFVFIPLLPTKAAYENKAFSDYASEKSLIEALKDKDVGDMMRGYIYFNKGIMSEWKDGTERVTKDTRKWWELGYTSCSRGCCVSPPCTCLIKWKSSDGDESLSLAVKEHRELSETNMTDHEVRPRPMPRFKPQVIPHKREWQEFKRVSGPGGLEEQLSLIKNKTTIWKIYFVNHGSFVIN